MSTFEQANYFLRTVVYGAIVGLAGFVGWQVQQMLSPGRELLAEREKQIAVLQEQQEQMKVQHAAEVKKLNDDLVRVETAIRLMKMDYRLARLEVVDQIPAGDGSDGLLTTVRFFEVGPKGEELGPPVQTTVKGKQLYIEAQVVQFKDEFVEQGDALRGRSICRFRRMFGEFQAPKDGVALDRPPTSPNESALEQELWKNFWDYANDPTKAEEHGVRAACGNSPSMELRPGRAYRVELRASGGLTITADGPSAAAAPPASAEASPASKSAPLR